MTLMISPDAWSAKMKMQVLLCSSLILPSFVTPQKSLFAVVTSPSSQAGISSQTTSHMAEPHRNRNGGALQTPALPRHLCSRCCSCCGSASPAIPTAAVCLGEACEPLPQNSCLISRQLTQECFLSVSPLYLVPKKTSQPYYHQHLQLINLADLGPRVQKFSKGGMRI